MFNIIEHNVFGEYMLARTSWLEGTDQADRWLIMPKVSIKGKDSYLVWDANSFNQQFLEDYQIMVSVTEDNSSACTEVLNVEGETAEPKTRGISLADHDAMFMLGERDEQRPDQTLLNLQRGTEKQFILDFGLFQSPGDTFTMIPFFRPFF